MTNHRVQTRPDIDPPTLTRDLAAEHLSGASKPNAAITGGGRQG